MRTYEKRIDDIAEALDAVGVPYTKNTCWDGFQLRFPWDCGDVVCHTGSYGRFEDKVETYQFPWDDGDVSCLSTEAAVAYIVSYYFKEVGENELS